MFKVSDGVKINGKSLTVDSSSRFAIDTDLFIPTGEKLIFQGSHSISKITLYDGGDELIGTSSGTLELSGGSINLNGAGGSGTPTVKMGGTTVIDSSRNLTNIGSITSSGPITVSNVNNTYNFKAIAGDTDSWFGVYDDDNNSANIILTRSDGATMFRVLGHTGAATLAGTFNCETIDLGSGHVLRFNGTDVIDSSRNIFPYQIRASGGDDTPLGTQFSNVIKGQNTNRTIYFDGYNNSVSTWYGVGNNAYAAIDCVDGTLDVWVNPSSGTWYNIADFTTNGLNVTTGGVQINGTNRINSVGDGIFTSLYIGSTGVIDTNGNIGAGGAADSGYDLKVYGLARFQGAANFVDASNPIQVGGTTIVSSSRRLQNLSIDDYIGITEGNIRGNNLQPTELMHYTPGDATVLADSKNFNALAFRNPTFYKKASGTWSNLGVNKDVTNGKAASAWGSNIIARDGTEYIFYFANDLGYTFMSSLTVMHSTNGNSMDIHIETAPSGTTATDAPTSGGWVTEVSATGVGSWPGSTTIKKNVAVGGSYRPLYRIRIVPTFSHASNPISIGQLIAKAGYGGHLRLFDWDGDRNVTFDSGNVTVTGADKELLVEGGTKLRIRDNSISASNSNSGLQFDGNYGDGRYRHRLRKEDNGGGIPLWLDKTSGTANSYTTIARFGNYSGNPEEFRVYGAARIDDDLNVVGGKIHVERGTGLTTTIIEDDSTANGRGQLLLDSHYSDMIIGSRNSNANKHGSTLTFATQSTSTNDYAKIVVGQGQYQEGAGILAFAYALNQTNPHNVLGTDNVSAGVVMDVGAKRIGIGGGASVNPLTTVHVSGGKMAIASTDNSYGQLRVANTSASEVSIGFLGGLTESTIAASNPTATYKWAAGLNIYGCGANSWGIGNAADGHEIFRLDQGSKMTLGHDGDNPQFTMVYDDNHGSGDNWDTVIQLGRLQDKWNGSGNYPTYQTGNGYGMYMQSNSDGCFFGMEEYSTGNYRPVVAWGDDTSDSPFNFKYNNSIKFQFSYDGNFTASGNVTAYSDERLKSNIETLDGSKVLQMRGVSFTKNGEVGSGVIAQELEKVAPELVSNEGEYKSVAYGNLTGYLIEAIKEQQEKIEKLEELVQKLISEK